jgi:hypothetical protein
MSDEPAKKKEEIIEEAITLVCEGSRNASDLFYLSSDVDAGIKFYDDINKTRADDVPEWLFKALPDRHHDFLSALFTFCFNDMNEDFREKIKKLGGKL